jgi:hypothetical protein
MLFRVTTHFYCQMHTKHENTRCCQNPQFLNVRASNALKETSSVKYTSLRRYDISPFNEILVYSRHQLTMKTIIIIIIIIKGTTQTYFKGEKSPTYNNHKKT